MNTEEIAKGWKDAEPGRAHIDTRIVIKLSRALLDAIETLENIKKHQCCMFDCSEHSGFALAKIREGK